MATPNTPTFGELLRHYRLVAGLTQEGLAERAHLSTRAIGALEQGSNRVPRAATLSLLAEALALSSQARTAFVVAARQETRAATVTADASPAEGNSVPPLVGRTPELGLLEAHLAGTGPPVLLLAGEPGIGKSRLLGEALRQGAASGWQVLAAGCTRRGGQLPYAPILQALQQHSSGLPAAAHRTALRGCAWLVRLLPELADGPIEPLPPWSVSPEQERRLIFGAVARFLANVAGPAGTLLVLDDLQWAGADALDLLANLVRAPSRAVRIAGAYRDTEVQPVDPLAVTLADLAHAGLVRHHSLPPLGTADVRHLLDGLLDDRAGDRATLATRVTQRTGGVPFFVLSCAQMLLREAAADADSIPWDVAQSIRQRVAALSALAQEVLGATAISVARAVQVPVLAAVLEQPERDVVAALEEAWRARLLEDTDGGYRLTHDLIRDVLEADLGPARRALLHRRLAEVLAGRPGAALAEVLAHHYGRSDVPERAVAYLEQAGDHAYAQQGHAAAVSFYRDAVERLDRQGQPLAAAPVREKLGRMLRTGARYAEALSALDPAAAAYRTAGDLEATGRVVAQIAGVHVDRGTPDAGLARLEPVLALLAERGPSRALATLYNQQADLFYMQGRLREQLTATEQGERMARLAGDEAQRAEALYLRGDALVCLGRLVAARETLAAAIGVAEAVGASWTLCWALAWLAVAHLELGDFAASREAAERGLQLAERHGYPMAVVHLTLWRGWSSFYAGTWDAARRDFVQALALDREIGSHFASFFAPLSLATLCLAEGAEAEAEHHLTTLTELAPSNIDATGRRHIALVFAERDLRAGRPAEVWARLAPWLVADTLHELDVTPLLPLMAGTLLDLGNIEEAVGMATRAVARSREQGRQGLLADALRAAAIVAVRQGRWEEAAGALGEGLALARHIGYPYAEARLSQAYGELFAQTGQHEAAREQLEEALAIFQRLGARRDVEQTVHLMWVVSGTRRIR
jgi:tetratricopeptide (TPR) repeat protein/transcriptional regulator with XRE-family HTH domain